MPRAFKATRITDLETGVSYDIEPGDDVDDELVELVDEEMRSAIFEPSEDNFFRDDEGNLLAGGNHNAEQGGQDPLNKQIKEELGISNSNTARDLGGLEYGDMTVPELRTLAQERNVDLAGASKKGDIIALLEDGDEE